MDEIIVTGKRQFDHIANAEIHGAPDMPRVLTQGGSNPIGVDLAVVSLGADTRHCIIRDVHNVWWGADANGGGTPRIHGMLYDVRVYNIGWQTTAKGDRESEAGGHGQYLYAQNFGATGQKLIDTCVFAAGFSWGKIYGTNSQIKNPANWTDNDASKLSSFEILNSIFVSKAFLIGGVSYGADKIDIDNCSFLDCVLRMGFNGQNGTGTVTNTLLTQGIIITCRADAGTRNTIDNRLVSWEFLRFTDNVVVIPKGATIDVTYDSPTWLWNDNIYYSEESKPFVVRRENPKRDWSNSASPAMLPPMRLSFEEWQAATGFDKNSAYHAGLPDEPIVREYPVEGLGKRTSNLAIYNPARETDVALPDTWALANIANILNPLDAQEEGVIYMDHPSALPEGWEGERRAPLPRKISPTYGVFRLEEVAPTVEDDAAAKIATLEKMLKDADAVLVMKSTEIAQLNQSVRILESARQTAETKRLALQAQVDEQNATLARLQEQTAFHLAQLAQQQKIIDVARALWEASGRFGALMDGVP